MAAYQGLEVEGDPYPEETLRRFGRGTRIGRAMAEEIVSTLEAKGRVAHAEVEIPWPADDPIGVGHADIDLPDEDTVVEVVSTEGCALPANKALQVAGYAINLGRSKARVLSVDPKTGEERVYPVNVEGFRERVEAVQAAIVAAMAGGPLPDRFDGAAPGAYPCFECPFRRGCFAEWTPPPAGRVPGFEEDFERLAEIERRSRESKREAAELESERDEIRERLAARMEPGQDYIEAGIRIRRTEVAGRRSLSFTAMEAAGYLLPADVAEFVTESKPHSRWTVKELER